MWLWPTIVGTYSTNVGVCSRQSCGSCVGFYFSLIFYILSSVLPHCRPSLEKRTRRFRYMFIAKRSLCECASLIKRWSLPVENELTDFLGFDWINDAVTAAGTNRNATRDGSGGGYLLNSTRKWVASMNGSICARCQHSWRRSFLRLVPLVIKNKKKLLKRFFVNVLHMYTKKKTRGFFISTLKSGCLADHTCVKRSLVAALLWIF